MSGDLLSRATRALRDATPPSSDGMEEMLARLPVSAAGRGALGSGARGAGRGAGLARYRRHYRAAIIALAATFVGLGAWARVTGRLPALFATESAPAPNATEGAHARPLAQRGSTPRGAQATASPAPAIATAALGPIVESAPQVATPPQTNALAERSRATVTAPARATLNTKPTAQMAPPVPPASALVPSTAAPVDVEALYREAHRSHFTERNFGRALELWDQYLLRAGSGGRMLIEARFNRAIALVRLGRGAEAREALTPFAEGQYGGYRRDDARRVLESLERR